MTWDSAIVAIQEFYSWMEKMEVSASTLIGLAAVFALVGLIATREAATWFFKINALQKEIDRLHQAVTRLEDELRLRTDTPTATLPIAEPPENSRSDTRGSYPQETQSPTPISFPISH